ncbi:MAG TPA: alpha/beta hydrolase family protein [Myxococcales bacterium]|jgi:dienelactone hydrolase
MHPLDRLVALALPRGRFFRDGWGDRALMAGLSEEELLEPPEPAQVIWRSERRDGDLVVRDGLFESPELRLPQRVRLARVRRLASASAPTRALLVLLSSSGDQGYRLRTELARPLVSRGITALLLENAFYGRRRPLGQSGYEVRTVSELSLMGLAIVKEAKALLALARRECQRTCVAGYSMGGNMTAVVAATMPFGLAAVPLAPSASPARVFTEGALRIWPALRALADDGEDLEAARARLRAWLARFDATRLPPPRAPQAAIVVGTRADGFVPPHEMERIAAHWRCELRWLEAGHASAYLFHRDKMRRAVLDAIDRLPDGEGG